MAFLSSILKLRLPSRDGSDAAHLANIIADLGEDVDAKVGHPSLTTAQILALTGDEKAAGRRVWDVTAQVEKVSNGTTWVEQASRQDVDALGTWQTFTPDLTQGVAVSFTGTCRYVMVGDLVTASVEMNITGAGTAGQDILVTLPVLGASGMVGGVGGGSFLFRKGAAATVVGMVHLGPSEMVFRISDAAGSGSLGASRTCANGDRLVACITYQAA
jgi:hypothetical protein